MKKLKTLSIVIPAYNEEKSIKTLVEKVLAAKSLGLKKEIIIVNDGSSDKTAKILNSTFSKNKSIRIIHKKKNEGIGSALRTGFMKTKGDIVLVQDADLEYDPKDYPILLKPYFENDADVVYGSRYLNTNPQKVMRFWHTQVNKFLTMLSNMLSNLILTDMETGYKSFKGEIIREIAPKLRSKRFGFEPEVTARLAKNRNLKFYEVSVSYIGRSKEEGKKITWKDGAKAMWEIFKYNVLVK